MKFLSIFFVWLVFGGFAPLISAGTAWEYDHVFVCRDGVNQDINTIDLHWIDAFYFVIVGPIAILICLFFLLFLCFNLDLLLKQPGDLYLGATLSELVLAIHWTIFGGMSLFDKFNGQPPVENEGAFCQVNSFISIFAGTWEMLYNICFCIYLIQKIRSLMDPVEIPSAFYHILACVVSFLFTLVLQQTHNIGKNLFGTCSFLASSKVPFLGPIVLVFYYCFSFYAIFYFKHYIPEAIDQQVRQRFLTYYYRYLWATSIFWIPVVITNIISSLNCAYFENPLLDIALTVGNINKLNTPIFLTVMRMHDIRIRKRIVDVYRKWRHKPPKSNTTMTFCLVSDLNEPINRTSEEIKPEVFATITEKRILGRDPKSLNIETSNELSTNTHKDLDFFEYDDPSRKTSNMTLDSKKKMESDIEINDREDPLERSDYWLNSLTESAKALYLKSMILGILLNVRKLKERRNSKTFSFFNLTDFTEKTQRKKLNRDSLYVLDGGAIQTEFPEIWAQSSAEFENLEVKITYYSPKLFDELLINDNKFIDLDVSLNIDHNIEQIRNSSRADGGRGGQFFFFSHDHQIILKSLSNDDFKCMKKILQPYYNYMVKNANSLIMRIYGVYEFTFFSSKNRKTSIFSQKLMIMRNLSGFPKSCVERIYDLKGSTFQRESLAKNRKIDRLVVLKDVDFLKLERKLFIEESKKEALLETLKKDSFFFKNNGIIDYSLLVIKINLAKATEGYETPKMEGLWSLDSTKEKEVKYHVGIIDYLQPYNYKKIFEKYSKKLIKAKLNLDTSAQDPIIYSNRFCKFLGRILEEEKDETSEI